MGAPPATLDLAISAEAKVDGLAWFVTMKDRAAAGRLSVRKADTLACRPRNHARPSSNIPDPQRR